MTYKIFFMNNKLIRIFLFLILIMPFISSAQTWHVGDLYTFSDGSQGIVCYVNPTNAQRGWVVALNDIGEAYALWSSGNHPSEITNTVPGGFNKASWVNEGKKNTKILLESNQSPAAEAVNFYNGWYIPDAIQMRKIYANIPIIKKRIEHAGGEILSLTNRWHWTSSTKSNTNAYILTDGGGYTDSVGTKKYYIRPVRDFGDDAVAYWVDPYKADSTITGSMKVSPSTTTTYDAVVVYGKDTFRLKGTAIPCHKYDKDTLYELVCRADTLYNSKKDSHFTGLDISVVKNDYYTYRDTLQTVKGCDSVITLKLLVVDDCENVYADSICPIETSYSILDTTFLPGTVSGIYARPGKKFAGSLWIDTVSYIDLTVFTPPTVSINDLVETCPLVGSQVLGATITDGKTPYTYTWSTVGTGITLSDASIPAPTVTIPTTCGVSYTIKLDVTDGNGCKADQATKIVTVKSTDVPVINTTFASADLGCNPGTITAPTFTVTDNCEGTNPLPNDSVTVTGPTNTGCSYTQSWTAHYTDACGNKAKDSTITYTWTVDTEKPVIASTAVSGDLGCNPSTITAPTFTVTDNCEGSFTLTADSVTVTGPTNSGCSYTQSWTAHYTDACGNKAKDSTVTFTWTVDTEKPVISSSAASADLGCNPGTITAPTFTVTDACEGSFILTADSVTVTGPDHTGCDYTQSWTAHYTDACGNKAKDSTVTYTWTETTTPTITTSLTDKDFSCIALVVPPTVADFSVNDACDPSATVTLTEGPETVTGYVHSKTWTATYKNACDQHAVPVPITYKWKDATTVSITCPADVYDTLDFGDCEMKVNITTLGTPTTSITPPGTPFGVTNDFPTDSVFSEGENFVRWVIIDSVCGYTDTCTQRVMITFPKCPDAVDCEGYVYHGVRIGCDCRTQRNLESKKYSDCTDIPCVYEYVSETHPNVTENVARYGRLYCFEAAIRDSADNGHGHIQGICPAGWYLPTPEKYEELGNYGVSALKYPSYWISADGTNTTGFSALPAGYFNGTAGRFEGLLGETYFWSTSGTGASTKITICALFLGCNDIIFVPVYTGMGYSVRCIKEKEK
jgi:uncharacterized protein (TIGR02145 family)